MIPKRIIVTSQYSRNHLPCDFESNLNRLKQCNPEYEILYFNDAKVDSFIIRYFPQYMDLFGHLPRRIMQIDLFRLLAVYHMGGFYFDMDVRLQENLDDLLCHELIFPLEWTMDQHYFEVRHRCLYDPKVGHKLQQIGNYAFGAKPRHPFLLEVVDNISRRAKALRHHTANDRDVLYITGPDVLNFTRWSSQYHPFVLRGSDSEPFQARSWGPNHWHKFGSYGEHLLKHSWVSSSTQRNSSDYGDNYGNVTM